MKKYKILNLYACLGGNRYKWNEVCENIEVTAVELDSELARLYKERFPNDTVIVADAHEYLLESFKDFDFIWSSPPCPSHSRVRVSQKNKAFFKHKYADMKLYQEIILLENFFDGKYCIENVIPYYKPLMQGQKRGRHIYWANFTLPKDLNERKRKFNIAGRTLELVKKLSSFHDYDFKKYKGTQRTDKIARNLVDYEVGKSILAVAMGIQLKNNTSQLSIV